MAKSSGGGGRSGRGGGGSATLSPQQRVQALSELGRQSDTISRLNARAESALTAYERTYNRASTTPAERQRLLDKYESARQTLRAAYSQSVSFSRSNGITTLPEPTGLQQRGSR